MKRRFIIVGPALGESGTTGGNSKIAIETTRHLIAVREVCYVASASCACAPLFWFMGDGRCVRKGGMGHA